MEKEQIKQTLKLVKENSQKRNFKQSIDLVINLKDIDLKKQDQKVDIYTQLHFDRGKKIKICALVGPELLQNAKANCDTVVTVDDFGKYDKKKAKSLANSHHFFIAQANLMAQVASAFGKVLGSRGKMPNPKAGCVVPPNANLAALAERLRKTVRIKVDTTPIYQVSVGVEDSPDEEVVDNVITIYNNFIHALPNDIHNFKDAYLKMTMGKPFKIGEQAKAKAE